MPANPMTLTAATAEMSKQLKPAYALLDQAVADGAFPGGVLAVGWNGQLAMHPFGKLEREGGAYDVDEDSMYDVASLSKPIVTTTAVMLLAQQGRLDLNRPVESYLPAFGDAAKSDPNPAWRA